MKRFAVAGAALVVFAVASAALAAGTLSGTYRTVIGSAPLGGALKGTWMLVFNKPAYTVSDDGAAVIRGTYTTNSTTITFHDKTGKDACPNPGVYKFKLTATTLKFTRVSDSASKCAGREGVLAATFTKTG